MRRFFAFLKGFTGVWMFISAQVALAVAFRSSPINVLAIVTCAFAASCAGAKFAVDGFGEAFSDSTTQQQV